MNLKKGSQHKCEIEDVYENKNNLRMQGEVTSELGYKYDINKYENDSYGNKNNDDNANKH